VLKAIAVLAAVFALGLTGTASARTKWLCAPGVTGDPCRPQLTTDRYQGFATPAGRTTAKAARDRGVACFYVYPTVSDQTTRLATKRIDPELRSIALYQAARYSQLCRVYAPVYRQATVSALFARTTTRHDYLTAYRDVEDAFDAFLTRIGPKRGFVLLGHSQGAFHLQRLVRERIDRRRKLRTRLVSAILLGGDVTVRKGSDRGGVFRNVPVCRKPGQVGCAIAFSTFNEPPPPTALFGRGAPRVANFLDLPNRRGLRTACTNPASLARNRTTALRSIAPTAPFAPGTLIAAGIDVLGLRWPQAPTTFVEAGGAFTGRCSGNVLRIESAPGTPVPKPSPSPDWGLHLIDANVAQGDILELLRRQIRRYG
jgi:pimeloyl-ACP methyl ester carboxylesterase